MGLKMTISKLPMYKRSSKSFFLKVSVFILIDIALMQAVCAQTSSQQSIKLSTQLQLCSDISDRDSRLLCFDELALNLINTDNSPSKVKKEITSQEADDFAKEQLKKSDEEREKEINSVTFTISALSKNPYGKWYINFENGQKWQQKDNNKLSLKVGQRVVLTKGALSAIYLQKENTKKRIKVKRLK